MKLAQHFDSWLGRPFDCPSCLQSADSGLLCPVCDSYLTLLAEPCPLCAAPDSANEICGQCLQKPPPWDDIHIGWEFTGVARFLTHRFKYQRDFAAGRALADQWLAEAQFNELPQQLIATPMHHAKHANKGFNQTDLMTKRFSKALNIPIWQGLKRIKQTPPLEGLTKKQRRQAVKGAFAISGKPLEHVAIIDDVYTSGATAAEMTRILKKHGCKKVSFWALARTPLL